MAMEPLLCREDKTRESSSKIVRKTKTEKEKESLGLEVSKSPWGINTCWNKSRSNDIRYLGRNQRRDAITVKSFPRQNFNGMLVPMNEATSVTLDHNKTAVDPILWYLKKEREEVGTVFAYLPLPK